MAQLQINNDVKPTTTAASQSSNSPQTVKALKTGNTNAATVQLSVSAAMAGYCKDALPKMTPGTPEAIFCGSSSFCVDLIFRGIKPTQNDKNNDKTARWFKMAANIAKRPILQEAALCVLQEQRDR